MCERAKSVSAFGIARNFALLIYHGRRAENSRNHGLVPAPMFGSLFPVPAGYS
jgi:hypothetical protein